MNLDVTAVEKAEESIDAFIEKRTREKADANKVEDFWREQDRRHQARRRNALRGEWCSHHRVTRLVGRRRIVSGTKGGGG
jgi:hypothetical protein